jgi:hypothetical protein
MAYDFSGYTCLSQISYLNTSNFKSLNSKFLQHMKYPFI